MYAKATFAAGCFWGIQLEFDKMTGVVSTRVGYSGGHKDNPTYEEVCSGTTDHAEVVEIVFDPSKVSYDELLERFFHIHDPTQLNRQGPDVGTQYRSVVYTHDPSQEKATIEKVEELTRKRRFPGDIVTTIQPAQTFWAAEEYHQKYFEKNGGHGCSI